MSYQCPKCGNLSEQQVNFCRKCGAPIVAESLPTMPLATETTTMPTPVTEVLSTADPATSTLPKPSQTAAMPPTQTKGLPATSQPAVANPPTAPPPPAIASPPKKSNKNALIAAIAVALIAVAGISFYFMNRANAPVVDAPLADQVTPTPAESATPVEVAAAGSPTPMATESGAAKSPTPTPSGNVKVTPTVKAEANVTPNAVVTNATPGYPTPSNATPDPAQATPTENAGSLIEQGNRLAGAGQFQEAIQAYEKARRANPGNTDVYYLIGSAYHRSGDLTNALEAYRKCTSGTYASVAANNAKNLEKRLTKVR